MTQKLESSLILRMDLQKSSSSSLHGPGPPIYGQDDSGWKQHFKHCVELMMGFTQHQSYQSILVIPKIFHCREQFSSCPIICNGAHGQIHAASRLLPSATIFTACKVHGQRFSKMLNVALLGNRKIQKNKIESNH